MHDLFSKMSFKITGDFWQWASYVDFGKNLTNRSERIVKQSFRNFLWILTHFNSVRDRAFTVTRTQGYIVELMKK